jgi:hypothetical protein
MDATFTSPFSSTGLPEPRKWWHRLFGKSFPDRAAQAIQFRLAKSFPDRVSDQTVTSILHDYGVAGKEVREVLGTVLAKALTTFIADDVLSDQEAEYLERLTRSLNLGWDEVQQIMKEVTHPRFKKAISEVIADGEVSEDERAALKELAARLRLPEEAQLQLYAEQAKALFVESYRVSLADERFSPEERSRIDDTARKLGVDARLDPEMRAKVDRFAFLWQIENGQLPVISAPINLQKGEVCHFTCQVEWSELRTHTKRIDYAGPTGSIRIARGIRFRVGSIVPRRVTAEELTLIDQGTLYITSKRVLFNGAKKNTTIRHSALLGVQPFADGMVLEKATGRSPHLRVLGDTEVAVAILCGAMAEV